MIRTGMFIIALGALLGGCGDRSGNVPVGLGTDHSSKPTTAETAGGQTGALTEADRLRSDYNTARGAH